MNPLESVQIAVGERKADVLRIIYDPAAGLFHVYARIYLPGSDGSVRGMVGTHKAEWGEGSDLGAAMKSCAEKLANAEAEFNKKRAWR